MINLNEMKTENVVLMKAARESLKGKWGLAIGTFVVYLLIVVAIQIAARFFPASVLISLIIGGPMAVGLAIFALSLSRSQDAELNQIFKGFENFGTAIGAYFLIVLFIVLWMLLLIVPGIIAAFSYALTFYIIADDKSIGAMQAIDKSKKMMYGYKWKCFRLGLRLFGLALLCILTLGIGFLWFMPYAQVTMAKFYDDVKENQVGVENQ
jgi:uncharacterized membrane protein